jgi:hypothetical protein
MHARIDDGKKDLRDLADRVYSDGFLAGLAKRFAFDLAEHNAAYELRRMAYSYIALRRDSGDDWQDEQRTRYRRLRTAISGFAELLKTFEDDDIATDLFLTGQWKADQGFASDELIASQKGKTRNDLLYRHLLGLLDLLDATAQRKIASYKGTRGPRRNDGLEAIVMKAFVFWKMDLKRRFTVDYHKGAGLTEAFQFLRALIDPLDDVTDQQIISTMRRQIALQRGGWEKRAKGAELKTKSAK